MTSKDEEIEAAKQRAETISNYIKGVDQFIGIERKQPKAAATRTEVAYGIGLLYLLEEERFEQLKQLNDFVAKMTVLTHEILVTHLQGQDKPEKAELAAKLDKLHVEFDNQKKYLQERKESLDYVDKAFNAGKAARDEWERKNK